MFDSRKARLVASRDLRDAIGDLRLLFAMGGLALLVPLAGAGGIRGLAYFGGGVNTVVERLTVVGAFFVVFLPATYSLVLALESFVGERERSTLEVLLSTPLRESEIYAGKVAAVLAVSLTLSYGALLVCCFAVFPGLGYFPAGILLSLAVSTVCQIAAMVAGAVIVSANARTMRAANVMAAFIILPMSVVLQSEAALILLDRGALLWAFAALMALGAVVLLRMGLAGFSREALLAREAGARNLFGRARRALAASFRSRPGFARLLAERWPPIAIAAFSLVAGSLTGYLAAVFGVVPRQYVQPVLGTIAAQAGLSPIQVAVVFFAQHLSVLLVAAVFAPVTLGLVGSALNYVPGFAIGYAAGLSSWALALGGIMPHALIEIPVTIIAGGLLLECGARVIHMDPSGGWAARVIAGLADYLRALRWLAPALAAAAVVRAYAG